SDWTHNELLVFHIVIHDVDVATFFGTPQLPAATVSPVTLNNVARPPPPAVVTKAERIFFEFLNRANLMEKAAVDDFSAHPLRILDFDDNERSITTMREMTFTMCGTRVCAKADIAVMKASKYSLIVHDDKARNTVTDEPVPQLVAEAIATFNSNIVENNRLCQVPLPQQIILGITMVGPRPIFYKIAVTQDLVSALITAQYPAQPMVVQRLVPPVADQDPYLSYGMNPLEDCHTVFQCLEVAGE
ncbi:hypothetical protein BDP27DRAFT_1215103, partial [Rhodocollybia butyracea]